MFRRKTGARRGGKIPRKKLLNYGKGVLQDLMIKRPSFWRNRGRNQIGYFEGEKKGDKRQKKVGEREKSKRKSLFGKCLTGNRRHVIFAWNRKKKSHILISRERKNEPCRESRITR